MKKIVQILYIQEHYVKGLEVNKHNTKLLFRKPQEHPLSRLGIPQSKPATTV